MELLTAATTSAVNPSSLTNCVSFSNQKSKNQPTLIN